MKIGVFSTFIEPAAFEFVLAIENAISSGEIPETSIAFIFSNREEGEAGITDDILYKVKSGTVPLISLSARRFKRKMREEAKTREKEGDPTLIREWRNQYGEKILRVLPQTDIDFLLGDLYIWGENLCADRNGVNLHPALPDGPKGEWYNVIWELIQKNAPETGVMMHKVIPEVDRGPVITYCHFSLVGYPFDLLRQQLPKDRKELEFVVRQGLSERDKTSNPLHREIRRHGLAREFPLIIRTVRAFAEGRVRFHEDGVVDRLGNRLDAGYDLTREIDGIVRPTLEGQFSARKEVRS